MLEKNGRESVGKHSRYLNAMYFFIMDVVDRGKLTIEHCPMVEIIADYTTKPRQGQTFLEFQTEIIGKQFLL